MSNKRQDYLSWDEYFMGIAQLTSMRSKDPNTQVGACIASEDNRVLSVGYNGAPNNFDDDDFPWAREGNPLETKYPYVCHAELNAILNFRGNMRELQGARIYVYYFPCVKCTQALIQAGISEVIYLHDFDHSSADVDVEASIRMFKKCGVKYRQFNTTKHKEIILKLKD